jgi:membrane protease YdiL (CAAX protease family)
LLFPPKDLTPPAPTPPPATRDTRLGIVLRVAFFVAAVFVGVRLLTGLLYTVFGLIVAGTLGLCASGLLGNLLTMKIFDRRPFSDIGLQVNSSAGLHLLYGLTIGGGSAALILSAPLLAGSGHLVARQNFTFTWSSLIFYLAALALAAAGEEMIFHGYAFQLLVEKMGPFATVLPVGVIFGLTHSSNPHATLLAVLNTILWGTLLGYAFLRSRDLWLPIGMHFGWNAVLPMFGVNLSGLTIEVSRYSYRWDLLPLWSGGDYGPEGGLLTTILVITLFFVLGKARLRPQRAAIASTLNDLD